MLYHRWATIHLFLGEVLAIKDILQNYWSKRNFIHGMAEPEDNDELPHELVEIEIEEVAENNAADAEDADDQNGWQEYDSMSLGKKKKLVTAVDEAILDESWWAYCSMVRYTLACVQEIGDFAERCPCHEDLRCKAASWSAYRTLLQKDYKMQGEHSCKMQTRRAPEFAVGALHKAIDATLRQSAADVSSMASGLTPAQSSCLLRDWSSAVAHCQHLLLSKLGFWTRLPHVLCGLAHHDDALARRAARQCIALSSTQDGALHHPLSALAVGPESPLRRQIVEYGEGKGELADYPQLLLLATRLKFVPVTERSIEGRHRITKLTVQSAPNVSPGTISLRGRQHELEQKLLSKELPVDTFGELTGKARHCKHLVDMVRMRHHAHALVDPKHLRKKIGLAVYRCDLETQFLQRQALSNARSCKAAKRVVPTAEAASDALDQALALHAGAYFQQYCSIHKDYYSLPNISANMQQSLASDIQVRHDPFFDEELLPQPLEAALRPAFFFTCVKASSLAHERSLLRESCWSFSAHPVPPTPSLHPSRKKERVFRVMMQHRCSDIILYAHTVIHHTLQICAVHHKGVTKQRQQSFRSPALPQAVHCFCLPGRSKLRLQQVCGCC